MTGRCLLVLWSVLLLPASLLAADAHRTCSHCGCCLRKAVRMECTTEDVVEHVYDCKCEDFALPGPSKKCHVPCASCEGCCDGGCGHHDKVIWQPGHCGKPRTRKMLVKYEMVKKVPAYQCVVEYVCDHCRCGASCIEPAEVLPPMPPPPAADDKASAAARFPVQRTSFEKSSSPSGFSWRSIFGG